MGKDNDRWNGRDNDCGLVTVGKPRMKVSIYKYSNSCTVVGRVAFDNKYKNRTLNCGSLSIVFAKATEVIIVHGYIYIYIFIRKEPCSDKLTLLLILGDEISTLRILGFGRCYNLFIYILYIMAKFDGGSQKHNT